MRCYRNKGGGGSLPLGPDGGAHILYGVAQGQRRLAQGGLPALGASARSCLPCPAKASDLACAGAGWAAPQGRSLHAACTLAASAAERTTLKHEKIACLRRWATVAAPVAQRLGRPPLHICCLGKKASRPDSSAPNVVGPGPVLRGTSRAAAGDAQHESGDGGRGCPVSRSTMIRTTGWPWCFPKFWLGAGKFTNMSNIRARSLLPRWRLGMPRALTLSGGP